MERPTAVKCKFFFHRFTGSEKLGQTLKVSAEEAKGFMKSFLGLLKILS